jgi:hypothetical protein
MNKKLEELYSEARVLAGKRPKFSTQITYKDVADEYTSLLLMDILVEMVKNNVPLSKKQISVLNQYCIQENE